MIVVVRPWKFEPATMISAVPSGTPFTWYAHLRATFIADSTASAPEFIGSTMLGAGQLGQLLAEQPELVVVERPAGQRHPAELLDRRRDQRRVPVAEVQRRVPGQEVQVPLPATSVTHAPSASAITTGSGW